MEDLAVYIHIPFCDHKCIYCDFYSIIRYENTEEFFISIHKEIEHYAKELSGTFRLRTIFFGGGTPSFVNPKYLQDIIETLKDKFKFIDEPEITMETNPGTVNKNKLEQFKAAGINRFSVGIQSFNEDELKFLTRIHDKKTAVQTVEDIYSLGIENISIDLIFNLPGQSLNQWNANLEQAIKLPVKHISTYSLILEQGTILNKMVLDGKVSMQDEDYDADLYEYTIDKMTSNGFFQYEVSNFCKPGFECEHNLVYWKHNNYLGLGTSSHSFVKGSRWWNYSSLKMYIESIKSKGHAIRNMERLTVPELLEEYIMLNMRSTGLDLTDVTEKFGDEWYQKNGKFLNKLLTEGFISHNKNFIKFTKKGYSLCDEILANLK